MTYNLRDNSFHTPIKITKEKVIPARPVADRRGLSGVISDLQKEKNELKLHIYKLEIGGANSVIINLARERLYELVNEISEKASEYRSTYQVIMPPLFNLPSMVSVKSKPNTNNKSKAVKASKYSIKSQGIFGDSKRKSTRISNKENIENYTNIMSCFKGGLVAAI